MEKFNALKRFWHDNHECGVELQEQNGQIYFKAKDIAHLLSIANVRAAIKCFGKEKLLMSTQTNGGIQDLAFLTQLGCIRLITRTSKEVPTILADAFGFTLHKFNRKETDFVAHIKNTFNDVKWHTQYTVGAYRVDLYCNEHDLVLEYDEDYHNSETQQFADREREKKIQEIIGPVTIMRMKERDNIFHFVASVKSFFETRNAVRLKVKNDTFVTKKMADNSMVEMMLKMMQQQHQQQLETLKASNERILSLKDHQLEEQKKHYDDMLSKDRDYHQMQRNDLMRQLQELSQKHEELLGKLTEQEPIYGEDKTENVEIEEETENVEVEQQEVKARAKRVRVKGTGKCKECDAAISNRAVMCPKCATEAQPKKFEISKEELDDLVNVQKIPFTTLGKRFGVSDNAIRKRCRSLGITVRKIHKPKVAPAPNAE